MNVRDATHAGSWYSADGRVLDKQLVGWLSKAGQTTPGGDPLPIDRLRAIIAPHAGYSYSGPAAGYAYKCINPEDFKRVFILGPSHHVYLPGCAISKCVKYETPLGDLTIDQGVNKALEKIGQFGHMSLQTDQAEHSIEMHLPYVYKVFEKHVDKITIVPILVGALTESTERQYGKALAPYTKDPENLFIISSDFCHWGTRFDYTYYADENGAVTQSLARSGGKKNFSPPKDSQKIFESIQELDHEGMDLIEHGGHAAFCKYLSRTKNTICGRHPIGVLLAALEDADDDQDRSSHNDLSTDLDGKGGKVAREYHHHHRIQFVHYAQSSSVLSTSDSSVSYASAFVQHED
ncbi:hypothetical protein BGZ67_001622 [Mortierella alpina]|nr:hypothetical protein BGZ67_001622 [Mortierella alpina]